MRLSVFSPTGSPQLLIDLQKLYQDYLSEQQLTLGSLENLIQDPNKQFYVTLFNARHLGAVQVTITQQSAQLTLLCVRDITRRRGVGKNLLREVELQLKNEGITSIHLSLVELKESERAGMIQFMQVCGYQLEDNKLTKTI